MSIYSMIAIGLVIWLSAGISLFVYRLGDKTHRDQWWEYIIYFPATVFFWIVIMPILYPFRRRRDAKMKAWNEQQRAKRS